jgi:hypothetical protein
MHLPLNPSLDARYPYSAQNRVLPKAEKLYLVSWEINALK